jgi:hypothetical protein
MLFLESRLGYQPAGEPQHCYYCIEPCKGMFTLDQYAGRDATAFVPSPHHPQDNLLTLKVGHQPGERVQKARRTSRQVDQL